MDRLPLLARSGQAAAGQAGCIEQRQAPQPDADAAPLSAAPAAVAKLLRLPGVEPLLRPEVAKWLDLSPAQKEALQNTNQVTQIAMRDLEKYWGDSDRLEKRSAPAGRGPTTGPAGVDRSTTGAVGRGGAVTVPRVSFSPAPAAMEFFAIAAGSGLRTSESISVGFSRTHHAPP